MTFNHSIRLIAATPLIVLLAACGGAAEEKAGDAAKEGAPPEIKQRHDNFEAIGDAFKAIRTQLEGGSPDMAVILTSATDINDRAQKVAGLFPEGTSVEAGYDTEALAAIWETPAEFEKAASNFVEASAGLKTAAELGDAAAVGSAAKVLGGTCKACHDKFRVDDE